MQDWRSIPVHFGMQRSSSDSLDSLGGSPNIPHFEMPDASLRQGALYALVYVVFALALTASAVWIWPRLGPWIWAHI